MAVSNSTDDLSTEDYLEMVSAVSAAAPDVTTNNTFSGSGWDEAPHFRFLLSDSQAKLEGGFLVFISSLGTIANVVLFILLCVFQRNHGYMTLLRSITMGDLFTCVLDAGYAGCRTLRQVWLVPRQVCLIFSCLHIFVQCLKACQMLCLACDQITLLSLPSSHAERFSLKRMRILTSATSVFLFLVSFPALFSDPHGDDVVQSLGASLMGLGCGVDVVWSRRLLSNFFMMLPVIIAFVIFCFITAKLLQGRAPPPGHPHLIIRANTVLFFTWFLTYIPVVLMSILLIRASGLTIPPGTSRGVVYLHYVSYCVTPAVFVCFPQIFRKNTAVGQM